MQFQPHEGFAGIERLCVTSFAFRQWYILVAKPWTVCMVMGATFSLTGSALVIELLHYQLPVSITSNYGSAP